MAGTFPLSELTTAGLLTSSELLETVHSTSLSYEFYTEFVDITTGSNIVEGTANNSQDVDNSIPLAERIVESIILSIIWVLAFWGNLLLWLVVFRRKSLQTVTNAMVLCLSFADLLVSIVNLPFTILTVAIGEWIFDNTLCVILGYMNMLTFVASVMSLAAIGICRYLFIVHPEKFRRVYTRRNTGWIIAGVWIFSGLLASPPLLGWGIYDYLPGQSFCFCKWSTSVSYTFFMVGVCFGGPCSVMTFCYVQILRVVRKSRQRVDSTMKRQSTISAGGKVPIPPVLKVPPAGGTTGNDLQQNRNSCSSFTVSVTSNSGASTGQSDFASTSTANTTHNQIKRNCNSLKVPIKNGNKRNSVAFEQVDDRKLSDDDDQIGKVNGDQQQPGDLPDTTPPIITDNTSSTVTSNASKVDSKAKALNGTNNNTTESVSRQSSVAIEEERPSFLGRLSNHGSMMKSMVSTRRARRRVTVNERSKRRRQEELKLTKSFVVVIFCFIICWLPFCVAMFWSVFGKQPPPRIFDMGTLILGYFNSCCNPIIYGVMNTKFRAGYKAILCNSCGRNKGAISLNSSLVGEGSLVNQAHSQNTPDPVVTAGNHY